MPSMHGLYLAICWLALVACAPAPGREIRVGMAEYAFLPAVIEVATGERIRLVIQNTGRLEHDFAPDQRGRALGLSHAHLGPNGSAAFDWTAPSAPAEVAITCTIAGHEALGMVARVVVRPGARPSPSASR